ncbi:MAG: 3-hydroxyacyl-CoA dehydrogenase [Mesorhizobium sp.]|uniref:3-hydroxyacyl-CoA dehydrogenase NAD-binding domain-containing protein n=1 Tax=Mesorhizobium sp. TaxID=1871066 RepID=UPI000FE553AE|nr:3-hydroxyacyl-CoA dehydrogenase NAD-binding domain-containing protein [Mesorhizobium sp.]RWI54728.1 MAG: 3-hydroxyacyl-CoA dehydrogenase [Mesorhizobium sp.]
MSLVSYERSGRVALLRMQHSPVNSLGLEHRRAILAAFDEASQDPAVKAIVLAGSGRGFSAGADINEFGTDLAEAEPNLRTVIGALSASSKPVIAAIHGVCMGGGLELALGCHYRVARPDAQIALPEVKLGLLPGAGGTQRMPRLVGFERAINMIISGAPVHAKKLGETALFDRISEDDVVAVALEFADEILHEGKAHAHRPDLRSARAEDEGLLQFAHARAAERHKDQPAVAACIKALRAAIDLPLAQGLERERELFGALLQTPQSKALRHAFLAERRAAKVPGIASDQETRTLGSAAVIGAGTMGVGIAMCFINAGIPVTVLDQSAEALGKARDRIAETYKTAVARGKLSSSTKEERLALLGTESDYNTIAGVDIVVEAVFEDLATKEAVFRRLDAVVRQGAVLATNTSTLDVNRIAAATSRPQDVIGLHFFSPAHVMRLLEIVRGETSTETLATAMTLAKRLGKVGVISGVCDGFIGNRMVEQYLRQAFFLLDEGALPQQVDRALEAWGFAMGPFRMSDLAGNDIGWYIRKRRYAEQPEMIYSRIADVLCEHERFGQKVGRGWYRYEVGKRAAIPDPEVTELVLAHSASIGVARRKIEDSEIVERCVLALVNEGAQILDEGIAARASDIDVVYLAGYGFPAHRGGPMWFASELGFFNVERAMLRLARNPHGDPDFWTPSPLINRLAHTRADLNR